MAQTQLRTEQIVPGDYPHYIQEPYDGGLNAMTVALLHFNSDFTDETGNVWTPGSACPTGTAGIDTGVSKFGGGSLYLKSNPADQGDYITTPLVNKYNLGSNDFAIEFWINGSRVGTTGWGLIFGVNDYSLPFYESSAGRRGWSLWSVSDNYKFSMNGYEFMGGGPFDPIDDDWHHVAICRQGNLFSSYYDGVRTATGNSSNPVLDASGTVLSFGWGSGGTFYGEICGNYDELRLTVGSCIYSGTSFSLSENLTEEFYRDVAIVGVTTQTTNTDGNIPQWTTTGTQLSNGLALVTSVGITGSNSSIPSEKAVRDLYSSGTFLGLTDTPDSYLGYGGYYVGVNPSGTALYFTTGTFVNSIRAAGTGTPALIGAVTLSAGANISLVQSGNDIAIASGVSGTTSVVRSGLTTSGNFAVWNGSNADSIKNGGITLQCNLLPDLLDSTWLGYTVSDSEHWSTLPGWMAFAHGTYSFDTTPNVWGWITNGSALPQWLRVQLPNALIATGYAILPWWADSYPGRTPKSWTFEGSNDGSNWTTLDTQTNLTTGWSQYRYRPFSFSNTTAYAYYQLNISANQGNTYTGIGGLQIYGSVLAVYV